jgi:hypothetical protein
MNWLSELYELSRIRHAEDTAAEAKVRVREQELSVGELQRQVERLTIAAIALMEILRDQHVIADEVIAAKMREVEIRGDVLKPQLKRCDECGQLSGPSHATCLYCGTPLPREPLLPGMRPSNAQVTPTLPGNTNLMAEADPAARLAL